MPVNAALLPGMTSVPVPVLWSWLALSPLRSALAVEPSVSVCPEAMSSVPLKLAPTVKTFAALAVKPVVTCSVPPLKVTPLPAAPRLFSALMRSVPELMEFEPE